MAADRGDRGQGVGRGLLDHLIHTAPQLGVGGLSLSVEDGNSERRLYERVGFTVAGRGGDSDTMSLVPAAGRARLRHDPVGDRFICGQVELCITRRGALPPRWVPGL